mgnify:CR=1 FL=1
MFFLEPSHWTTRFFFPLYFSPLFDTLCFPFHSFSNRAALHNKPIAFSLIYLHLELDFVVTYLWSALLAIALFCTACLLLLFATINWKKLEKKKEATSAPTAAARFVRPCQLDLMATNYSTELRTAPKSAAVAAAAESLWYFPWSWLNYTYLKSINAAALQQKWRESK